MKYDYQARRQVLSFGDFSEVISFTWRQFSKLRWSLWDQIFRWNM